MPPTRKSALVCAVEILAKRLVSRRELLTKLNAKKCYSTEEIAGAVHEVERMGALHDDYLAADIVRCYRERGYGPARIRLTLRKRGIPDELAAAALDGVNPDTGEDADPDSNPDADNAFAVLNRKSSQLRREPDARKRKAKAVRWLVSRGFSFEDAISSADRWMQENPE